ncbi:hypothetical protein [Demequina sp.]|uniref:hypothetical protein n=1 Tax=Demequina sp. TaxID=2050685 RepID=UPI003D10888A
MALVIVAVCLVAVMRRPDAVLASVPPLGERAPSDFALDLSTTTSPLVRRGEAVSMVIAAPASAKVNRVELWRDGELYYALDDTDVVTDPETGSVRLNVDVVSMTAGGHVVVARAYGDADAFAQSAPIALPTMDLEQDLVVATSTSTTTSAAWPGFSLRASAGDTLASIATRLGVDVGTLATVTESAGSAAVLTPGTIVTGIVPAPNAVLPGRIGEVTFDTDIHAVVDGCEAVVTSSTPGGVRIYGGAGMVALGDIEDGQELRLGTLPVGPTMLAAYAMDPQGAVPASAPVTVTIPDECALDGWTGDARISGGLMMTDTQISKPYVYMAIDKGQWQRVPAQDGVYLSSGTTPLTDLRSFVDLSHYDQIDLQVYSGDDAAAPSATGQYCRAASAHAQAGATSASGGECTPADGAPTGAPGTAPTAPLTLTMEPQGAEATRNIVKSINVTGDPTAMPLYQVSGPGEALLQTDGADHGVTEVMYQFSYIPFSPGTSGLNPPGMFWSQRSTASHVIEPWNWHSVKVTADSLDDVDELALTDQLALNLAKARLAQGRNLIDEFYVRAVAISTTAGVSTSLGFSSNSIKVSMPDALAAKSPSVANAQLAVQPGIRVAGLSDSGRAVGSTDASGASVQSQTPCIAVVRYPEANRYTKYPMSAPKWKTLKGDTYFAGTKRAWTDTLVTAGVPGYSDLEMAKTLWSSDKVIYCQDLKAAEKRQEAANNYEPPTCGLGCVLSFVAYGAFVGLVVGGPPGALYGALVGLGLGLGSAADPSFYASVMETWDAVADVYNGAFDAVWTVVETINPVCLSARGYGNDQAGEFCNGTVRAVASAIITYYTGLPPQIATSEDLEAAQQGNIEAVAYALLDEGLKQLGLSCDDLTIPSGDVNDLSNKLAGVGVDVPELENADGDLSMCAALARGIAESIAKQDSQRRQHILGDLTGEGSVPGLIVTAVTNTQPVLTFTGGPVNATGAQQSCPLVANVEITEDGSTYRLYPLSIPAWLRYAHTSIDGNAGTTAWTGEVTVPPHRTAYYKKPTEAVREVVPAAAGAPYLSVQVDGPCLDTTLTLTAKQYFTWGSSFAYLQDKRPIKAYW